MGGQQQAPSLFSAGTGSSPQQIATRLLARFGDRRFVRRIRFVPALWVAARAQYQGLFSYSNPRDGIWAVIDAPVQHAHGRARLADWEIELVKGALRDDVCRAGGRPLLGWIVPGTNAGGMSDSLEAFEQRFANPTPVVFRSRLATVARRYGFRVVSLRFLRPRELAPVLVIETDRERKAFVDDIGAIMSLLDPRARSAVTFEGFYLEARDGKGPFVGVWNVHRGQVMGGQWSSDPCSFPYDHGGTLYAPPCP